MKSVIILLNSHGIQVVNNQIAKADVDIATKVIAKDELSEEEQITVVRKNPSAIQLFENPSEAVQLAAFKAAVKSYDDIKFVPSEAVQLTMVKKDGENIRYIKNPPESVQIAAFETALKRGGHHSISVVMQYTKNPTKKVKEMYKVYNEKTKVKKSGINLDNLWELFPKSFKGKFKKSDSDDGLVLQYKELFQGDTEKYWQFLDFEDVGNNKVSIGMSSLSKSGTDGLGYDFGTFDANDVASMVKAIEKADIFGN